MEPQSKTMSDQSIEERVKRIVCNQMGTAPEKVTPETSFVNDLDLSQRADQVLGPGRALAQLVVAAGARVPHEHREAALALPGDARRAALRSPAGGTGWSPRCR